MPASSYKYETVAVSQTAQALGASGAAGDRLKQLVISVSTAATSTVALLDDTTSIPILAANTAIGVYTIDFGNGVISTAGAWKITTGAGATVIAVGDFS